MPGDTDGSKGKFWNVSSMSKAGVTHFRVLLYLEHFVQLLSCPVVWNFHSFRKPTDPETRCVCCAVGSQCSASSPSVPHTLVSEAGAGLCILSHT